MLRLVKRPRVSEDDQGIKLIRCREVLREPLRQEIIAGLGASLDTLLPKLADRWYRCQLGDMWHPG